MSGRHIRLPKPEASLVYTHKVGLDGLFRMIALVLSVIAASSCSGVILKSCSGRLLPLRNTAAHGGSSQCSDPIRQGGSLRIEDTAGQHYRLLHRWAIFRGHTHAAVFPSRRQMLSILASRKPRIAGLIVNGADSSQLNGIGRVEIRPRLRETQRVLPSAFICFIQIVNRQRT